MNKKQKILSFSGIGIIIIILILYVFLSEKTLCKNIDIIFIETENNLINKKDIETVVFSEYKNLLGSPVDNVNLEKLEKKIEMIPAVKNAEVFKKINGVLGITIEQRTPVLKVLPEKTKGFYIDENGELMPLSKKGTVRVLTATGNIKYKYKGEKISVLKDSSVTQTVKDLYLLAKYLNNDNFFKSQAEQIYVKRNNEYELVPLAGNHIVLLGDIFNYRKKLKYLKYFYTNTLNKEGWQKYKYINLKFKNQIVCTKR